MEQGTIDRYDFSDTDIFWLRVTIVVPIAAIWLIAANGFLRLLRYAEAIQGSAEGQPIRQMANGIMILAFGFVLTSIAGSLASIQIADNPNLEPVTTVFRNYFQVAFPLIAFIYINNGAAALSRTLKLDLPDLHTRLFMLGFIILASVYTAMMVSTPFSPQSMSEIYFLPEWLVILSIIVPYLFTWYNGLGAAYWLIRYGQNVKGVIYKQAFGRLAFGFIVITITAIILRFISTIGEQLIELSISPLLTIIYTLVFLYALGYGLVSIGANRLARLEKV